MTQFRMLLGAVILFLFSVTSIGRAQEEEPFNCHELYEFTGTSGDIYSPFYKDGQYPNGIWCEYRITAPVGYRLKLTLKDLDIDPSDFCGEDQLVIYAKEKEDVIATVCGKEKLPPFITDPEVNVVRLLFRTDSMSSARGFHLHYEAGLSFEYCEKGLTQCHNRKCYNAALHKCNGVDDCGDGTDEEGCNLPLATSECGKPPIKPETIYGGVDRIIGGQEVKPGSWPWQISMQNRYTIGSSHSCGGSLINAQWVVTAAHCFKGNPYPQNWRIHMGKHHKYFQDKLEQIRYGERIIIWPDLTGDDIKGSIDMTNDIALIKLSAPVKFTDAVRPVCLPSLGWDLPFGSKCYVTGWGETRGTGFNHVLKQTYVSIMPKDDCSYNGKSQICVRNKDTYSSTCHGDSGGPLACILGDRWYVMGATSYGTMSNFITGLCAMPGQRTVFMKVSDKVDWINSMIQMYS